MQRSFFSIKHLLASTMVCLAPMMAQADGVYLLQLGSFDNLGEAKARWASLKSKYPELLKDFSARFQDVQLPPDNFVVYRTQAGALEDRSDAEIVCDQLSSRGDECYVVETAMFRPDLMSDEVAPPLSIVNPAAEKSMEPVKAPQLAELPEMHMPVEQAVPTIPQPAFVDPAAPAAAIGVVSEPKVTTRIVNPAMEISKPAMKNPQMPQDVIAAPEVAQMQPMAAPNVPAPSLSIMKPRPAPQVMPEPALAPVDIARSTSSYPPASSAPYDIMAAAPTISAPTMAAPTITPPTITAPAMAAPTISRPALKAPQMSPMMLGEQEQEEEGGFWSWINDPFSSDEGDGEPVDRIEYVQADQNDSSWFEDMLDPFSSDSEPDVDSLNFEAEREMAQAQAAVSKMPPQAVKPIHLDKEVVESFKMPPPPPPQGESAMHYVAQQRAAAASRSKAMPSATGTRPVTGQAVANIPGDAPFAVKAKKGAAPKTIAPALSKQAPVKVDGDADVAVAEAIRVPVTNKVMPDPIAASSMSLPGTPELKKLGLPSGDVGNGQSLWAQIYYFGNQQTALAYWEAFRAENPTFPPVRVRVTQPYQTRLGTAKKVSLRVGPFSRADMVTGLCAEVEDTAEIECKPIAEMGKSSIAAFSRRGTSLSNRYEQRRSAKRLQTSEPMYWVQLGSFNSQGMADQQWSSLSQRHKPLLDQVNPNVASPIMNSSMQPVYRLRTGPYAMRSGADQLCASMKASGADCLVVFSR